MSFKKSLISLVCIFTIILFLCAPAFVRAEPEDEYPPENDEQGTFGGADPDALFILDLSGSMAWNPAGGTNIWGTGSCAGPTYFSSQGSGHMVNCSRVEIAKRAIFDVLDADGNGTINATDMETLGIRIGYLRFKNGNDEALNYTSGAIKIVTDISVFGSKSTGTGYAKTYCNSATSCVGSSSTCISSKECVGNAAASSGFAVGTPLAASLKEAKKYLDAHKKADPGETCRQKFVIVVSDGADTYACDGSGTTDCQTHMYKRRRETVAAAKALYDGGYKVFVVGFGATMPPYQINTLNWMAYYGGTDNQGPNAANSGDTSAYLLNRDCATNSLHCCVYAPTSLSPTAASLTNHACYPTGVNSMCQEDTGAEETASCLNSGTWANQSNFKATNNDPGYLPTTTGGLSGYAFLAADADQLTAALKNAFTSIRNESYSFTTASIQAVRTADENFIYEASFEPTNCPLWQGHLRRYKIDAAGHIITGAAWDGWDAGNVLANQTASGRNIKTIIGGSLVAFDTSTSEILPAHLAAATTTEKENYINFIRTGDHYTTGPDKYWRLGDIFHSSPMSIGTPNALFYDRWDNSTTKAYDEFRDHHKRTSAAGDHNRYMFVGANDGQLHAFKTGELGGDGGGTELWSFIPPNQLPRLGLIYHTYADHPSPKSRQYYVDGPTSAAEIWVESHSATDINNTTKAESEWKTLLVTAEGRGGISTLWSSSTSCDSGFYTQWTATYNNYCGYYAFDVSDTAGDTFNWPFLWRLGANTGLPEAEGKYLGQAWSKMFIGRVRINNIEKWVGFISGGYSECGKVGSTCPDGGNSQRGKGFYVVDLKDGDILWSYTYGTNSAMNYDLPAGPVAVDSDNDGFLDTAYVGDLGGNMWRFQFCKKSDVAACGANLTTDWSGAKLYDNPSASGIRPIFTSAAVSFDPSYNLWVYFGTGEKTNPTSPSAQERFFAIKDGRNNGDSPYVAGDLENIGTADGTYTDSPSKHGWRIEFPASEKVLSDPIIYQGRVYFTTYVPDKGSPTSNPCNAPGSSNVYNMDYITGEGQWAGDAKFTTISNSGVASSVTVSVGPDGTPNLYISTSAGDVHIREIIDPTLANNPRGSMIYWHDLRIQP